MSVTIRPGMNVPSGGVGGGRRLGFFIARGRLDGDWLSSSSDSLEETKSMTDEEDGEVATGGLSAVSTAAAVLCRYAIGGTRLRASRLRFSC